MTSTIANIDYSSYIAVLFYKKNFSYHVNHLINDLLYGMSALYFSTFDLRAGPLMFGISIGLLCATVFCLAIIIFAAENSAAEDYFITIMLGASAVVNTAINARKITSAAVNVFAMSPITKN